MKILSNDEQIDFVLCLEVFSNIIKYLHISLQSKHLKPILTNLFSEYWPLLSFLFDKCFRNEEVVENLTQTMKHFIRGMGSDFNQYLQDYLTIIVNGYNRIHIATYLYAFEVVLVSYNQDKSVNDTLRKTLEHLCRQTLEYLPDICKLNSKI